MSFLKWKSQQSSDEEDDRDIQSLLAELEAASYIADKRNITKELIDVVKTDPLNGSEVCLPTLLPILSEYSNDSEMCQNLLDTLSILVKEVNFRDHKDILALNIETIFKYKDVSRILFEQLDTDNMYIKLVVMDIIRCSLSVNQSLVGECINQSPLALQKLIDCLNDNREEIRNDLLLILYLLVEQFPDIGNFIAFQDGFDMLLRILDKETGVIARDCIRVIYCILHENIVTMKLFSQLPYINKIVQNIHYLLLLDKQPDLSNTIDFSVYSTVVNKEPSLSVEILQYSIAILEELTDLTQLKNTPSNDNSSILIIKNNIQLLTQCEHVHFNLLSIIFFNYYLYIQSTKQQPSSSFAESLSQLASRCQQLFLRYIKYVKSLQELTDIIILQDDVSSSLLSYLLQTYFNYSHNQWNNELFLQILIANPRIDAILLDSSLSTGQFLSQIFVKSLFIQNPPHQVNSTFIAATNLFLHCCRNDPTCFEAISIQNQRACDYILDFILSHFQTISLGILSRLIFLLLLVLELHSGLVSQVLQDIPRLISLMNLVKESANNTADETGMKAGMISILLICLQVQNQDQTFDLLTLFEKNIGLNTLSSLALLVINHVSYSDEIKADGGDVDEEIVVFSREFIDEGNSQYYLFRQSLIEYYLQDDEENEDEDEDEDENQLIKGLKSVLKAQDQEIKQLKIQLSAGGNEANLNWAQIAEKHEEELTVLQQQNDDLMLEKTILEEKLQQATKRIDEIEELLIRKNGLEGEEEILKKMEVLEETIHSLEEENKQLKKGIRESLSSEETPSLSSSESHEEQVRITKLETEIKELQANHEKENEEQLQKIEELKKIIEEKEEMIKSIHQQITSLEGNLDKLRKEKEVLETEQSNSKDEIVQLEIELSNTRATLLKLQDDYSISQHELKQVLLCVQQYYVECEVLKKGVLQLGGEEVLEKLVTSSNEVSHQLYSTKPSE